MIKAMLGVVIALSGCNWSRSTEQALAQADCGASAAPDALTVDAVIDAMRDAEIDAPADATVVTYGAGVAWPRITIEVAAVPDGADGVDLVGDELAVPHEEGKRVTRLRKPSDPYQLWPSTLVATGALGVEDSKLGDLDGDGLRDIASTEDVLSSKVLLSFANADGTYTTIAAGIAMNHPHWMQASIGDMTGDGCPDVFIGGRAGTAANPALEALLVNPCGAAARDPAAWTMETASLGGWTMTAKIIDAGHVFVTDRSFYLLPGNPARQWDLNGARILERTPTGWVNHRIATSSNAGDWMMGDLYDFDGDGNLDALVGQSAANGINHFEIYYGPAWTRVDVLPSSALNDNVGHYQAVAPCDVDGDGRVDLVLSFWAADVAGYTASSEIVWLRNLGGNAWSRQEALGSPGTKIDNVICRVLVDGRRPDLIANDQLGYTSPSDTSQLGTFILKNPYPTY